MAGNPNWEKNLSPRVLAERAAWKRSLETGLRCCSHCKKEKPLSAFYAQGDKTKPGLLSPRCKECDKARGKNWRKENETKYRNQYLAKYGIDHDDYLKLFAAQQGNCAVCGENQAGLKEALTVDHDHQTGKIRGLLCRRCNRVIGYLKESADVADAVVNYLVKHEELP